MSQNNTYKYLSIVLAIIAAVFIFLYFTKPEENVTDLIGDIQARAAECKNQILAWQSVNGNQATTSAEAREDLNDILEMCRENFEGNEERM